MLNRSEYLHEVEAEAREQSLGVYVLLGVIGVFCALGLVNTLSMATAERTQEFARLRLIGASTRQIRTMVRTETLIMITFGLAIGTIVAAPGLAAFTYSQTGSFVPSIPVWMLVGLLAVYALLGFAATLLPTRLALRLNPVTALAARE